MWPDWLVFCDYGFSVSALWCPLTTPTILLGFLLAWRWHISSRLLQQSTVTAPYLGRGHPSWPWTWRSSSRPSCTHAATAPWMCSCSSQPQPLTEMQYLDAISKMTEWSLFISKENHSISQWYKPMPQPVTLKKLKLNDSVKTYKTF